MSKTRILQFAVVLLLILFGLIWANTRSKSPSPSGPGLLPLPAPSKAEVPSEETPAATPSPAPPKAPPNPGRNPFELPGPLFGKLQERARQLELEKQLAAQTTRPPLPASPAPGPSAGAEELQLQGIFWGVAKPQAIINRKAYSVGDEVDGAKIVAISREGVTVSVDGKELLVRPRESSRQKGQKK